MAAPFSEKQLAPGLRQRKTRRYDPFTEAWTEVVITETEPEPEPDPPAELLEEVDLGPSSAPGAVPAAGSTPPSSSTSGISLSERVAPLAAPAAPPPPPSPSTARCVCVAVAIALVYLVASQLLLVVQPAINTALGKALRQASLSHDSAAVCALDAAELAYWSKEGEGPAESTPADFAATVPAGVQTPKERSQRSQDCADDPQKILLGSDCAAYSLHPGCEHDLHALYDGAIYGKEFAGTTVGMVCPRTCGLCS
jgi:hypothetical protein